MPSSEIDNNADQGLPQLTDAAQRILDAASDAFYWEGIQAVGIDTIIDRAGVARGTLYNNFGSKDDLIAIYLRSRQHRWQCFYAEVTERYRTPVGRLLAAFDAYGEYLVADGYRGCAFTNAMAELTDPTHPAQVIARDHKENLRRVFVEMADEAGCREPQTVGDRLQLLLEGAWVTAVARRDTRPLDDARVMAELVIHDQLGASR
jgi:AcrR family transcriptional regulator